MPKVGERKGDEGDPRAVRQPARFVEDEAIGVRLIGGVGVRGFTPGILPSAPSGPLAFSRRSNLFPTNL